jgi:hypothetical protein
MRAVYYLRAIVFQSPRGPAVFTLGGREISGEMRFGQRDLWMAQRERKTPTRAIWFIGESGEPMSRAFSVVVGYLVRVDRVRHLQTALHALRLKGTQWDHEGHFFSHIYCSKMSFLSSNKMRFLLGSH